MRQVSLCRPVRPTGRDGMLPRFLPPSFWFSRLPLGLSLRLPVPGLERKPVGIPTVFRWAARSTERRTVDRTADSCLRSLPDCLTASTATTSLNERWIKMQAIPPPDAIQADTPRSRPFFTMFLVMVCVALAVSDWFGRTKRKSSCARPLYTAKTRRPGQAYLRK